MKHLILFEEFIFEDGFGRNFFFPEKREKAIYYYFKINEGDEQKGFILKISKNCVLTTPEGSENSYACLRIEPISISTMDDHLANETDFKSREEDIIQLDEGEFPRIHKIISKAIEDYLQKHPKVTKIYDEILLNLSMSAKEYKRETEAMISDWSYGKWTIQDGPEKKILIYQKRDHA